MVRQAVIHVGMPKTGSTAIQKALFRYDDGSTFYGGFEFPNHSVPMTTIFSKSPENLRYYKRRGVDQKAARFRQEKHLAQLDTMLARDDRDRILISGETLCGGSKAFDFDDKRAMIDFFYRKNIEPRIVCYVRDPISYAASQFQQNARTVLKVLTFETLQDLSVRPLYKQRIVSFGHLVPRANLVVRPFQQSSLRGGDIVEDFCSLLDIPVLDPVSANASLSPAALRLLVLFSQSRRQTAGSAIRTRATRYLAQTIADRFASLEKIEKSIFEPISDRSELGLLETEFGLDLRAPDVQRYSIKDLWDYLSDLSDIDLSLIDDLLDQEKLSCGLRTSYAEKLGLYYDHLLKRFEEKQRSVAAA